MAPKRPPGTAETGETGTVSRQQETAYGARYLALGRNGMSTEIAGLPVKTEPRGLMTPLAAVAMIKGLTGDGRVAHWRVQTGDVTTVDAIGMHESAAHLYKEVLPGAERGES